MSVYTTETITIIFQIIVASCAVITAYVQVKNSRVDIKNANASHILLKHSILVL